MAGQSQLKIKRFSCSLDWNLLSTASPAINAWMNPSNRLAIRVVHMVRTMYRRSTATVACLMAEAMEGQHIHTLPKVGVSITKCAMPLRNFKW